MASSIPSVLQKTPVLIYGMGIAGQKTVEILQREGVAIHGFLDAKASPGQTIHFIPVMTLEAWLVKNACLRPSVLIAILNEDFLPQIPAIRSRLIASGFQNIWDMQELSMLWPEASAEVAWFYREASEWNRRYVYLYESGEFAVIADHFSFAHQFERYRFYWQEFWLLLASSLFICGKREKAEFVLDKYMAVHGLKDIYRYVPLAQYVNAKGWTNGAIEKTLFVTEKLAENRLFLDVLLSGKTVACVGNSPSELGKGRGQEIDAHDVVIRFNNFDVGPEYSADYGEKTSIWVRNMSPGLHDRSRPFDAILFAQDITRHLIPETSMLDRIIRDVMHRRIPVISIPHEFSVKIRQESRMSGYEMPTVGCITLCYILMQVAMKSIHCYGFSFSQIHAVDPDSPQYFKCTEPNRSIDLIRKVHDFRKESLFLLDLLKKTGHIQI
ncbi:MAG: glycosyltransferase family 29 protein [Dysgonamonadaceae bacterium]|jgi:hypothetical protein|nr:glycosyltransferase family 29 protein [Dysgonamonadaceae bacterium]